jgi:hypothetical protein
MRLKPKLFVVAQFAALIYFKLDVLHAAVTNRAHHRAHNYSGSSDARLDDGERLMARPIYAWHNLADRHVRTCF